MRGLFLVERCVAWRSLPWWRRHSGQKAAIVSNFTSHWLGSHSASPAIARAHTARFVNGAFSAERRGVASLLVSELVTNAVLHGRAPIRLGLTLDRAALRIEVSDHEPTVAAVVPRAECNGAPGGRGLRIVEALADQWGVVGNDLSKTVWASVALTADS
jgi:anti-sigma regulatory factor (Ser/Thr protein kinase)